MGWFRRTKVEPEVAKQYDKYEKEKLKKKRKSISKFVSKVDKKIKSRPSLVSDIEAVVGGITTEKSVSYKKKGKKRIKTTKKKKVEYSLGGLF